MMFTIILKFDFQTNKKELAFIFNILKYLSEQLF